MNERHFELSRKLLMMPAALANSCHSPKTRLACVTRIANFCLSPFKVVASQAKWLLFVVCQQALSLFAQ
jgi:hypothetical protein